MLKGKSTPKLKSSRPRSNPGRLRILYRILYLYCIYTVQCAVYCIHILCTVYCVLCTVYRVLCALYCVLYIVYCAQRTVYSLPCTVCILHTVYCAEKLVWRMSRPFLRLGAYCALVNTGAGCVWNPTFRLLDTCGAPPKARHVSGQRSIGFQNSPLGGPLPDPGPNPTPS